MVGEGHGRGIGAGAGCPHADAARRPGRPADEADRPGKDEGAALVSNGRAIWERSVMQRFLSLMVVGLALGGTAQAQSLTKVRVAYDGYSMTSAPLYYAEHEGIFKKFGLDVKPAFVEGGSLLTQAVVGGSIDIAQNGYTPAAGAAIQGADIVIIGGISNKLPFQLVVRASVKGAADLKGQSIAISRYGSSTDTAADFALKHLGLTRNDVMVRQLGGPATRNAALISGQVAGTMEQYPDTGQLEQQGFHVLVDVTDLAGDYPNTSYATSRTFLKNHPDEVKRFFMAMATAVHEFKRNPEVAIRLTQEFLKVKEASLAKAAYDAYVKVYPDDLRPSLAGVGLVLKEVAKHDAKAAKLKPEDIVDTSILDALVREGFFAKLAETH